jgi:hypothetical protein
MDHGASEHSRMIYSIRNRRAAMQGRLSRLEDDQGLRSVDDIRRMSCCFSYDISRFIKFDAMREDHLRNGSGMSKSGSEVTTLRAFNA